MTICANRTDTPGFFTSCDAACGRPCQCGAEVKAEMGTEACEVAPQRPSSPTPGANATDVISGRNGTIQWGEE